MMHFVAALAIAVAVPQEKPVNPTAAALYDFSERLNAYLKLREDLGHKLEPLAPTPSASRLQARQQALAAAVRNARKNARPGDLIHRCSWQTCPACPTIFSIASLAATY